MHTDLAVERRKISPMEGGIISTSFVAPDCLDLDEICVSLVESLREEEGKPAHCRDSADLEDNIGMSHHLGIFSYLWHLWELLTVKV
jgi:hypothetical protein